MVTVVARTLIKITHIKGRLLDQAVIFFNCIPFQNGNLSCSQEGAKSFFLKSSSLWYGKSLLPHLVTSLECYYLYYACAELRNGSYATGGVGLMFFVKFVVMISWHWINSSLSCCHGLLDTWLTFQVLLLFYCYFAAVCCNFCDSGVRVTANWHAFSYNFKSCSICVSVVADCTCRR